MKTVRLQINGMSCQHCVAAVTRAIDNMDGVLDLKVEIGRAEFRVPEKFDLESLIDAIEDQGYSVVNSEYNSG